MSWDESLVEHKYADLEDVRIHYVEAGDPKGPLVILLHGFPEFWYSWHNQIPALAAAGHRVIAPDLRGYNLSSKPEGWRSYAADYLSRDVAALIQHAGAPAATVVGHDWGGAVAWLFAMRYPELLRRLAILNAPHPGTFRRHMLLNPRQLQRSWYVFAFQLPKLPELLFRRDDFATLRKTLRRDPVRPGAFSGEDIDRYVEAMARPGSVTAAINYYRAALRARPSVPLSAPVEAPVLTLWGMRDRYLGPKVAEVRTGLAPQLRIVRIPQASHWVQVDAPELVNEQLLAFLAGDLPPCAPEAEAQVEPEPAAVVTPVEMER